MNKVILMGRLTRDPELRTTSSNISVCQFSIAVDRRFKSASGERQADFISCTAWRQTADFIAKYFAKGAKLAIVGSLQTSTWEDNEGKKQYKTEVVVDEAYFADSKSPAGDGGANYAGAPYTRAQGGAEKTSAPTQSAYKDTFVPAPDEAVLPFDPY